MLAAFRWWPSAEINEFITPRSFQFLRGEVSQPKAQAQPKADQPPGKIPLYFPLAKGEGGGFRRSEI